MRGQTLRHLELGRATELIDQSLSRFLAVQQDDRIFAACFLIGIEQRF